MTTKEEKQNCEWWLNQFIDHRGHKISEEDLYCINCNITLADFCNKEKFNWQEELPFCKDEYLDDEFWNYKQSINHLNEVRRELVVKGLEKCLNP